MVARGSAAKRPPARKRTTSRDVTINFRVSAQTRDLLDAAADAAGTTRTQFVVDSALTHAADMLLDRRVFKLDNASFTAFTKALDNPPPPAGKLVELLSKKAPWET
jgi:uncharacterized protein (DUF1778 family)